MNKINVIQRLLSQIFRSCMLMFVKRARQCLFIIIRDSEHFTLFLTSANFSFPRNNSAELMSKSK